MSVTSGPLDSDSQESLRDQWPPGGTDELGPPRPSLASAKVGGQVVALRRIPSCLTCCSPYRDEIENAFVKGYTPTTILRSLPGDANLSDRSIRRHFLRQHLPLENAVLARLVEEERRRQGTVVNKGADSAIRTLALSFLVRDEVVERLESGDLAVSVKDGLVAEAMIVKYEMATQTTIDNDRVISGLRAFAQAVKDNCSAAQAESIMAAMRASEDARIVSDWAGSVDDDDE